MLVSYKWLNELVDVSDIPVLELAEKMSRTGIEVEEVEIPEEGLKKIVVGFVESCIPHPQSDHLSICQVDVGEEELYQIVCGAPNIEAGKKVIVALPNSRITGNVKIKKGKMRGEVSLGMICSLQELGYSDSLIPKEYAEGIYFLPDEAKVGEPVFSYLEMDDAIMELSITPNRADALSMRGVAHEVGAIYRRKPVFVKKELLEDTDTSISDYLTVSVVDQSDTPDYRMRIVKDVVIKESPLWLQNRLMHAGIRPINNVVDVTNYVLILFGQPMHAFDFDKIGSKEILVRRGVQGEKLTTLDGEIRQVTPDNILITNGTEPIALAGVMGGFNSEITTKTTTVALESAMFEPSITRKTSAQFGLRSESSSRFEKGINVATIQEACEYAAMMIAELSGGKVVSGEIVATSSKIESKEVVTSVDKINRSLGTSLSVEIISEILETLAFPFDEKEGSYIISIPPRRWDITIEADIVEEVARIYGYDNLPSTLPSGESLPGTLTKSQKLLRHVKESMEASGFSEVISYALTTEEKATRFCLEKEPVVRLQSPMSEDHAVLRQSLTNSLLEDLAYNVARKNSNLALYETGAVFVKGEEKQLPKETRHLAFALTGLWDAATWQVTKEPVDFFMAKGVLEELFDLVGATEMITFEATSDYEDLHPGRTAAIKLEGDTIGFVGQVHPLVAKEYDLNETYVAELNLDQLFASSRQGIEFSPVPKFPAIKRDIALLVDSVVTNQQLEDIIVANGGKYLKNIALFDIFADEKLGKSKESMAYSLTFLNSEATLVDEEITKVITKITEALKKEFKVEVR